MQYNPSHLIYREILSDQDKEDLRALSDAVPLQGFLSNKRNYDEAEIDFVYTSAKIEGNTYTRADTDALIKYGLTAGGKTWHDAKMILNMRDAFLEIMNISTAQDFDINFISDLHKVLMDGLLPGYEQGLVRVNPVKIGGSEYKPLSNQGRLREEMRFLLNEAKKYDHPFERAIYLHCNLAYLQYFADGNKRTARMVQTAALIQAGLLPMFFKDYMIDKYIASTISYYETGCFDLYIDHFKKVYAISIKELLGDKLENDDIRELRANKLDKLKKDANINPIVSSLYENYAKDSNGVLLAANWAEINRKTFVEHVIEKGLEPDGVFNVIVKHSPGLITKEDISNFKEDALFISRSKYKKDKHLDNEMEP